jgi:hypothetical protein
VEDAGVEVPEHALLGEGVFEGLPDAKAEAVEPRLRRAGDQHSDSAADGEDEGEEGEKKKETEKRRAGLAEEDALCRELQHGGSLAEEFSVFSCRSSVPELKT